MGKAKEEEYALSPEELWERVDTNKDGNLSVRAAHILQKDSMVPSNHQIYALLADGGI
eukprot:SAG31_NODE_721_length_12587_cov_5.502002_12_plen_58_part_00